LPEGKPFQQRFTVPRKLLRFGPNQLLLQCYNEGDVRGESAFVQIDYDRPPVAPNLFGLIVGVGDYAQSRPRQDQLESDKDAASPKKALDLQKDVRVKRLYQQVKIDLLVNQQVTRQALLDRFHSLANQVQPDDRLVLSLGGHGALLPKAKGGTPEFVFCF